MNSRDLTNRLIDLANELAKASTWNGSGLAVDAIGDPYLYELLCYFHIALKTVHKYSVQVEGPTGTTKGRKRAALWPKKPGLKQNFSYLKLTPKSGSQPSFQLCPGIQIVDLHGKPRAPDVNLLAGDAPAKPTHAHVHLCWDAKYTSRMAARLPDQAVSDFVFTVWQLGAPIAHPTWLANISAPECLRSGLLTNARRSTEPDQTLHSHKVAETHGFPESPVTRP